MRIDRDKLIWIALGVLDRCAHTLGPDPEQPDPAVRLALAVLHELGATRKSIDEFWQVLREPFPNHSDSQRSYMRGTFARTQLIGIARDVGVDLRLVGTWHGLTRSWQRQTEA